jgi:predicted thioesterase
MDLHAGLRAEVEHTVEDADTARRLGSGDVDVFGTPAVVALCERAAVEAVAPFLADGQTTVGIHIDLRHLAPTVPGRRVRAAAVLEEIEGRTLRFSVEAFDDVGQIALGRHVRAVVDRARFVAGAQDRRP